jgi:hypothetical protein
LVIDLMSMTALPPSACARLWSEMIADRNTRLQASLSVLLKALVRWLVGHSPIVFATFGCFSPAM